MVNEKVWEQADNRFYLEVIDRIKAELMSRDAGYLLNYSDITHELVTKGSGEKDALKVQLQPVDLSGASVSFYIYIPPNGHIDIPALCDKIESSRENVLKLELANQVQSLRSLNSSFLGDDIKDNIVVGVVPKYIDGDINPYLDGKLWDDAYDGGDIALYYKLSTDKIIDNSTASIAITENMVKNWGVSVDEVKDMAKTNTKCRLLDAKLMEIETSEIIPAMLATGITLIQPASAAFINIDFMDEVAKEMNDDVIIVPSSTEEVLLFPSSVIDKDTIRNMVMDVNNDEALGIKDQDIFLSDNPIIYDAKKQMFKMITSDREMDEREYDEEKLNDDKTYDDEEYER